MKYIVILGDGMADEPCDMLGGKTPLQAAHTPNLDRLAAMGRSGLLDTIPDGYAPGSEIANLSVLGYDVPKVFEGRGSLEAASMGVSIGEGEMALRCNILTVADGLIKNHSAGHISTPEAKELIEFLDREISREFPGVRLHPGISYRHLAVISGGDKSLTCFAPHDHIDEPFEGLMIQATDYPSGAASAVSNITSPDTAGPNAASTAQLTAPETADLLNRITLRSQELLMDHPVNIERIAQGKAPANSLWFWSPGYRPQMETLTGKYGFGSGYVISAVDLIKGIGVYAGLKSIDVEGATGLYDTNYEGKRDAAIEALRGGDFVFLHIEASDEAGHEGDVALKTKTIEYLDSRVLGPVMDEVSGWGEPVTIAVLPDHPTPCAIKTHTSNPVPFVIYNPEQHPDAVEAYDEFEAAKGGYGLLVGDEFMDALTGKLTEKKRATPKN